MKTLPNGLTATIVGYRNNKDIDVQFSDGRIAHHLAYSHFTKGDISGTNRHHNMVRDDRVGTTNTMKCGLKATVVRYGSCKDIDVQFETGEIVSARWQAFKIGEVNPAGKQSHFTAIKKSKEKWEGQTNIASNGMKITLIAYRSQNDVDVLFEDGYIAHTTIQFFTKGQITNPNYTIYDKQGSVHVGEETVNTQGLKLKISRYKKWNDITVEFEDGTIINSTYGQFKIGKIENPNQPRERKRDRTGEETVASNGLKMKVIAYRLSSDIDVEFEDGEIVRNKSYTSFLNGNISHPTLSTRKRGEFEGFETRFVGNRFYECTCEKCGLKEILTPQQMMEHQEICQTL